MSDGGDGGVGRGPDLWVAPSALIDPTPFDPRTMPAPSATWLAAALPRRSAVPWAALEIAALERHPRVQDLLDPRRRWPRGADRTPYLLLLGLSVASMLAMVVGLAVAGSSVEHGVPSGTTAARLVAVLLGAAVVLLVLRLGLWWRARSSRRQTRGEDLGLATVPVAFVAVLGGGLPEQLDGERSTAVVVALLAVRLAALAVLLSPVLAWRLLPAEPRRGGRTPADAHEAARAAIRTLPTEERTALRDDLDRALDVLVVRGLLPSAVAERARAAELGGLAATMSRRGRAARPTA